MRKPLSSAVKIPTSAAFQTPSSICTVKVRCSPLSYSILVLGFAEDASDVTISSTYIRYADYKELIDLINSSTTSHSGLKTLSLLITTEYSAWEWYSFVPAIFTRTCLINPLYDRPILTFVIILFLPSCLTFLTLLIHRVRLARAAQRDRAPEHLVKSFPWRVWNGTTWEKHEGTLPQPPPSSSIVDLESGSSQSSSNEGVRDPTLPWYESQEECIICLSEFAKGDRVRELPCHHIFHLDEIDNWLINRKKLVSFYSQWNAPCVSLTTRFSVRYAKLMSLNLGPNRHVRHQSTLQRWIRMKSMIRWHPPPPPCQPNVLLSLLHEIRM